MVNQRPVADVSTGHDDNTLVAHAFIRRGYGVVMFEDALLANDVVRHNLRLRETALRHPPDLVVARPDGGLAFVEVNRGVGINPGHRSAEVGKMASMDVWSMLGYPVWFVDPETRSTWPHIHGWWARIQTGPTTYTDGGSGDPYAWMHRHDEHAFNDVWGPK